MAPRQPMQDDVKSPKKKVQDFDFGESIKLTENWYQLVACQKYRPFVNDESVKNTDFAATPNAEKTFFSKQSVDEIVVTYA